MSSRVSSARDRLGYLGAVPVGVELARVRRRANARLGSGIKAQTVRRMLAKLENREDQR